ncbi:LEAF RUST 10 DISEASE-RESISTANCE LOCUS RECEPTOR-LIKE PROTEIN KINASE-like 1.1, partial [Mucuna pruriens]
MDPFIFVTADIFTKKAGVNLTEKMLPMFPSKFIGESGLSVGLLFILMIGLLLYYKRKHSSSGDQFQTRSTYSDDHSLNPDVESGSVYYGIPLFSYKELEEATDRFDLNKQVGDGGFGTVYHGKLKDGREVAVKHLYEHNYRRVEQFMNEVQILTRLRHRNLVSLYGCTSRHSRELLLVYEYIPNGTVASHLHGELAKPGLLTWSIRIKIAVETANALAYLHASKIIHRDVKTNNILLDNSFCVKVADFGLSRLFPNDITHVSTAPQGTPGYVDPEYHQCYQLTSKSDVYSFGVVLIELISSMPAVDMNRHKDEINLSNLAVKKIQESALSELVDPYLGFDSDNEVKRMVVEVAELAFQCLQPDRELRPSMDEVLEVLKRIESRKDEPHHVEEADVHGSGVSHGNVTISPELDEAGLLKNRKPPSSPISVTESWESKSTTPNASS